MIGYVKIIEETGRRPRLQYNDRNDLNFSVGECDVPSTIKERALDRFARTMLDEYEVISCGFLSRSIVRLIVRRPVGYQPTLAPGVIRRPALPRKKSPRPPNPIAVRHP